MSREQLVIGTRGSTLAMWQAEHVAGQLRASAPGVGLRIVKIRTHGDRVRNRALSQLAGRGFFVKEIEQALLSGEVDLAVHSLKDLPTQFPKPLELGAVLERHDPHDALIVREGRAELNALPQGARVGTSSLRRRAQILAARPDLQVVDLRGNVDTRLRKLRAGQYDAVVLAAAGLARLGLDGPHQKQLPFELMLPAPGQGALAVECRSDDASTLALLHALHHDPTGIATSAERAFLNALSSGCSAPVGAHATLDDGLQAEKRLLLQGLVASLDGQQVIRLTQTGMLQEAEELGLRLAERVLAQGARRILEEIG